MTTRFVISTIELGDLCENFFCNKIFVEQCYMFI